MFLFAFFFCSLGSKWVFSKAFILMNVAAETFVSSTQIVLKRLKKVSFLDKFVNIKNEIVLWDFQTLWYVQKIRNVYLVRRNSFFQKEREFHCLRKKWLTFHFPHHDFSTLAILIQHLPRKYFCMQKFSNHISGFRNCREKSFLLPNV